MAQRVKWSDPGRDRGLSLGGTAWDAVQFIRANISPNSSPRLTMSAAELGRQLKVPANRITEILNGQRAITGDTALRLGHFFGMTPQFWLNLQTITTCGWRKKRLAARSVRCPSSSGPPGAAPATAAGLSEPDESSNGVRGEHCAEDTIKNSRGRAKHRPGPHQAGVMGQLTMREVDQPRMPAVESLKPAQIRRIRTTSQGSQTAWAQLLRRKRGHNA